MKPKHTSRLIFPALILAGSLAAPFAQAANQTWDGGSAVDGNWSTLLNWVGDTAAPGATSGTTNTDVATFNAAIANTWGLVGTPIGIDSATQNIGGISFGAATGNYFIGTTQMAPGVYKSSTNLGAGTAIAQIIGTGTLTVTSGASSNFASWANDPSKGNIPGEPPTGDFDNDGLTNLIEYALGKNPRVSSQPAGVLSGNVITFTKGTDAIANGDVSWFIETSTTLAAGSWTTQVTQAAGNPAATISYTFTPSTPVANFARLKVTQN